MYLAKIEECFSRYRKQGIVLSPKNWIIAERWEKMGIPLNIVCKGIKKTCRQFRSTHKEGEERIDLLLYCEPEILRLWKDYKRALLGAPDGDTEKGDMEVSCGAQTLKIVQKRLGEIRKGLHEEEKGPDPWGEIKAKALSLIDWPEQLDHIEEVNIRGTEVDIDGIEEGLRCLDKAYYENLYALFSEEMRREWEEQIDSELSPYKGQMEVEIYRETLQLGMESLMRDRLSLRRISLYAT